MTTQVDAVVLAGGKNSAALRTLTGVENRALVLLGGHTLLEHVLKALRSSGAVESIVVVGDVPEYLDCPVLAPGLNLVENLYRGIGAINPSRPVLTVTSDIPFLTPVAVDDFVTRAAATGADFCYPVVPLDHCQARFPQMKRTSLKVREGVFTGGNVMLLQPAVVLKLRETILQAYAARKSPLQLGRMLGWRLAAKILVAQAMQPKMVSIGELEAGVSRLLHCRAKAIITDYAEIATDIDKPQDLEAAAALFNSSKFLLP